MRKDGVIICNCCRAKILETQEIATEDFLTVKKNWGYFSKKDGTTHEFHICESCYDKWIATFQIPVEEKEMTELL